MAMALGFFAATEHMDLASHRGQGRPAGQWIRIVQNDAVVGIAGLLADFVQSVLGVGPLVTEGRRLNGILLHPCRTERADSGESIAFGFAYRLFSARIG